MYFWGALFLIGKKQKWVFGVMKWDTVEFAEAEMKEFVNNWMWLRSKGIPSSAKLIRTVICTPSES